MYYKYGVLKEYAFFQKLLTWLFIYFSCLFHNSLFGGGNVMPLGTQEWSDENVGDPNGVKSLIGMLSRAQWYTFCMYKVCVC